jgi:cell pole-organizing protein PopZ
MAEAKPQAEPSMEEILASIRRIISEDDAAPAAQPANTVTAAPAAQPAPPPKPAPAPAAARPAPVVREEEEEEDVLDLTERVPDDGTVVNLHADAARRAQPEEIELREVPPPAPAPAPQPEPVAATDLVSAATAAATTASFAALARAVDSGSASDPVSVGGRSLEDIVKEIMRPMIRDWLDANLPALVERLVRREVERIAHKGQDQ